MNNNFHSFDSVSELHVSLANEISDILIEAIKKDGFALMALSGGSTPKPLFEKLSTIELDWQNVTVTLVDERWVENSHEDSNEKLVKEHLIKNFAKDANFLPLKNSAVTPFDGTLTCNNSLKELTKPFDVVVLGMGNDGHTASFFPKDENLKNALTTKEFCAATIPSDAPHQRITLSLNTILHAKHLFLHIEGERKKAVYDNALNNGEIEEMPVRALLRDEKSLEVYYGK